MDKKRLESFLGRGEAAEKTLEAGRTREALKELNSLCSDVESAGDFDSFLAAKITLALLKAHIKAGDFKSAFGIWNAHLEESLHGIGIYALESAQTTVKDMVTYDMLCAFLHTLADSEKAQAASAVNQYLSRVCEHALEDGDRATMRMAISNWKQHFKDIFGGTFPIDFAKPLIHFEKLLGETVKPQPIAFIAAYSWQKPQDFLEMSRFAEIKKVKRPSKKKAS